MKVIRTIAIVATLVSFGACRGTRSSDAPHASSAAAAPAASGAAAPASTTDTPRGSKPAPPPEAAPHESDARLMPKMKT